MAHTRVTTYAYKDIGAREYSIMPYLGKSETHEGRKGRKTSEVSQEYIEAKIRRGKTMFRRIAMANNLHRHLVITYKNSEVYNNSIDKSDELLKNFFKKLRNIYPEVKYLATRETQSRGVLHYHILVNMYINIDDLNLCWNGIKKTSMKGLENEKSFKGWVSIQAHDSGVKAITYVTKYMVKDAKNMTTENGFSKKLYLSSKGIKQKVEESKQSVVLDDDNMRIIENELTWMMTNCDTIWDLEFDVKVGDDPINIRTILFEEERKKKQ